MGSAFIAANGLWSQEQQEAGARLLSRLEELDLRQVEAARRKRPYLSLRRPSLYL